MNQANITYKTINTQVATQLLLLLAARYLPSRVEVNIARLKYESHLTPKYLDMITF